MPETTCDRSADNSIRSKANDRCPYHAIVKVKLHPTLIVLLQPINTKMQ